MVTQAQERLDNFFSKYKSFKYKKGEILIRADDTPSGIFLLKEGVVKQYAISSNGEELVLNIYKPISIFPMASAINNTLPHHYFEAMTPVLVWRAPIEETLEFIKKEPEVLLDLLSRIYKGLEGFFLRMEYLMSGSARVRLITELLIYAKRFGEKIGSTDINKFVSYEIKLKITEKDLASQSGITRETVSREIQKLKQKNLLSFKKSTVVINDLQKLEEELVRN